MKDIQHVTSVAMGGAFGAVLRYIVSAWFLPSNPTGFPWGTFLVNITGCLLLGVLVTWFDAHDSWLSPSMRVCLSAGFLGALTTFSTFGWETVDRLSRGLWMIGGWNIVANVVVGLMAVGLGRFLAHAVWPASG